MSILSRSVCIRFVAADPERILSKLSEENIEVSDILRLDDLTFEVTIRNTQLMDAQKILQKEGIDVQVLKKKGVLWSFLAVFRRPILAVGLLLLIVTAMLLSQRILFVEVVGNESIPTEMILQSGQNCGIEFGAKASDVRSEEVKNYLLSQHPQLQWVGITTSGCIASIHVKERSIPQEDANLEQGVSSIVAALDGIITEQTVSRGTPLFQPGQSVKAGDVLISGYTDTGLKVIGQQAEGEIFAHTLRQMHVITPAVTALRGNHTQTHTCYRLRIGKKVINLCNHSGIPDTTCVKMYSEDYWTLPGGYQLPVSVIKVECFIYEVSDASAARSYDWLPDCAKGYLFSQMTAGQVLDETLIWNVSDAGCELWGKYACHEMIGRVKHEEILKQYAEDN